MLEIFLLGLKHKRESESHRALILCLYQSTSSDKWQPVLQLFTMMSSMLMINFLLLTIQDPFVWYKDWTRVRDVCKWFGNPPVAACRCDFVYMICAVVFVCTLPIGLKVSESSFQVIEQIHLFAALWTVNVQQLTVVQLLHLLGSLSPTAGLNVFQYAQQNLSSSLNFALRLYTT